MDMLIAAGNEPATHWWTSTGSVIVSVAIMAVVIVAGWKLFAKAGQPGWAILIPFLNVLVFLKMVKRPWWWIFLMLIPIVNIVIMIIVFNELSKAFGHGLGMTLLLIFLTPIAYLVLGFGSSQYQLEKEPIFSPY